MSVTREAWDSMSSAPAPQVGVLRRRILADQPRDLFVGLTQPDRRRVLIVSVDTRSINDPSPPQATRSVACSLHHSGTGRTEFHLTLELADMSDVFATFADDVADTVSRQPDDRAAVSALLDRFEVWRELLGGRGATGLTDFELQGIWAELWVLEYALHPVWGSGSSACWTAGDGDAKDFRREGIAVEVKSTAMKAPVVVDISSEYQLDTTEVDSLLLAVIELTSSDSGNGESLSERVDSCRSALGPSGASVMTARLQGRGYDQASVPDTRYVLRACTWYNVRQGFPRLVASDLPTGVGALRYTIGLDACRPWQLIGPSIDGALAGRQIPDEAG